VVEVALGGGCGDYQPFLHHCFVSLLGFWDLLHIFSAGLLIFIFLRRFAGTLQIAVNVPSIDNATL